MPLSAEHVRFNPYKHHLGFICNTLEKVQSEPTGRILFFEAIRSVNANFVDVYTGPISSDEIQEIIAKKLSGDQVNNNKAFEEWLGAEQFRIIALDDKSRWVLRLSEYKTEYVHIHPSRTSPMAVRVHGNAWRTVVGLLIMHSGFLNQIPDINTINKFRKEFLNLSPVKGVDNLKRVMSVYELIKANYNRRINY